MKIRSLVHIISRRLKLVKISTFWYDTTLLPQVYSLKEVVT